MQAIMSRHHFATLSLLIVACVLGLCTLASTDPLPLSAQEKEEMLRAHNYFRSIVNPPAETMPNLVWDPQLESIAQNYVQRCVPHPMGGLVDHNPDRSSNYPEYVGENIYGGSAMSTVSNMTRIVASWDSEKAFFDYENNRCRFASCGHYTQVVWADTTKLGCGRARCTNIEMQYNVVCNYARGGNFPTKPYVAKTSPTPSPAPAPTPAPTPNPDGPGGQGSVNGAINMRDHGASLVWKLLVSFVVLCAVAAA